MENINPDLIRERSGASFAGETLTYVWNGGENRTRRRRYIESIAFSDPSFITPNEQNLTRDELYSEGMRKHTLFWKKIKELNLSDLREIGLYLQAITGGDSTGLLMHDLAFLPMVLGQSSDEQLQRWFPDILSYRMIGSYAQTELGHGSFVRGLETTATYDPDTKTFVLNTPTVTSTKWWIGSLGKSCNYTVLLAQLYTKGRCHGIHAFLVQLRDIDTHEPLPGVTVGDIGPKLGFNAIDNGFLRLAGVRIPRENMLMKHSQVTEDGTYVKPVNDKLIYGGMLGIRANIPLQSSQNLACAATIAIRYSCVRRQSELKPNDVEPQILDYQTQQHKLFPLLAAAFAHRLTAFSIISLFHQVMSEVGEGKFERLGELHALAAGIKAVVTTRTSWGVEICRLACGGHGYSQASGLPRLYCEASAPATAEGEATILLLQTARYLMKNCRQIGEGSDVDSFVAYLQPGRVSTSYDGRVGLESLIDIYEYRTSRVVMKTAERLQNLASQMAQEQAWNMCSVQLLKAAVAHIDYVVVRLFAQHIANCACDPAVRKILEKLCTIYAIHGIVENAGDFVMDGYLTSFDLDHLRDVLYSSYSSIRPDALVIVDSFEFHDRTLKSAIGSYDGRAYEHLYEWASRSSLNATQVHETFDKYLKPMRNSTVSSKL